MPQVMQPARSFWLQGQCWKLKDGIVQLRGWEEMISSRRKGAGKGHEVVWMVRME